MNKRNLPLIIALSIPFLMIVLVAAFIYLPGSGQKPQHNFLYATGNNYAYGYENLYAVRNGQLEENTFPQPDPNFPKPIYPKPGDVQLYIYDVASGQSTEITFEQAKQLQLDPSNMSPDGFEVVSGNFNGGLFFGGAGDSNHQYLRGHNRSRQLNLKLSGPYSYSNFQFLGWIK